MNPIQNNPQQSTQQQEQPNSNQQPTVSTQFNLAAQINIVYNPSLKLLRACKQIKKILTGNRDAIWTLDCFHNVCPIFS